MKIIFVAIIFLFFFYPIRLQSQFKYGLLGREEKIILYNENWFSKKYKRYVPNTEYLVTVNEKLVNCKIEIFMGTWCRDTKMYLPQFIKLFDSLNIPESRVSIYNVNKKKRRPKKLIKQYEIKYLPTVVFLIDSLEVGRIVEYPYYTIEKDILKIFSKRLP